MYRPNFCAECGEQIIRLNWRLWTSRRFCRTCAPRFRYQQIKAVIITTVALLATGFVAGRAGRSPAPPLVIERRTNSSPEPAKASEGTSNASGVGSVSPAEEVVYICGARTKKGTPCSRRVHGPVRCWQHKGMRAMLAQEKLLVKDQ